MPPLSKTRSSPQRQPPPSLFLGPPSRDASHISLPSALLPGAQASTVAAPRASLSHAPLHRQQSTRAAPPLQSAAFADANSQPALAVAAALQRPLAHEQQEQDLIAGRRQADHVEALWADMQSTLEDVELSATHDTHVFGLEHTKALEELRAAQTMLAQAWAKSEADITEDTDDELEKPPERGEAPTKQAVSAAPKEGKSERGQAGPGQPANTTGPNAADKQQRPNDDEAEDDIALARKRRELNDRFFERINNGVFGVVGKLDAVAAAMRAVERESRDIWTDSADSRGSSIS